MKIRPTIRPAAHAIDVPSGRCCHSLLALCAAALLAAAPAGAAPAKAKPGTPSTRLSWYGDPSAPDLSGVWVRTDPPAAAGASKEGWRPWPPPLMAPFDAQWKQRVADAAAGKRTDDPVQSCLPPGMPRYVSGSNAPLLIIQTPGRVTMYRDGAPVRRIWLDGRPMPSPADLESFSNGTTMGHYEGRELVALVAGMKDQPIDSTGVPHSDALTIVERYRRVNATTLAVTVTLNDTQAYSQPMTTTVTYKTHPDKLWEPREFICTPLTGYHPEFYVH